MRMDSKISYKREEICAMRSYDREEEDCEERSGSLGNIESFKAMMNLREDFLDFD